MLIVVLILVAVGLTACAGSGIPLTGQLEGVEVVEPTQKGAFTLTDTKGRAYDFVSETEGRLTFLYFGYTNCPDICPVHLAQLAEGRGFRETAGGAAQFDGDIRHGGSGPRHATGSQELLERLQQ
jgi:cytochrome oxidase Cu insertion factor (SCO1/SenC/PrrC family)